MSKNIVEESVEQFNKNVEQFTEFQNQVMQSAVNAMQNFDPQKFSDELVTMQDNLLKGMDVLVNMKPEDIASDQLEKEEVLSIGKMRLFHYKPLVSARKLIKTPLLITYALVNRQYMLDLQPDRSVIKGYLDNGLDVYVIDWGYPTAEDMYLTLDDYLNWYLDDCVNYIRKVSGKDAINLMGVCQGGTFSIMYTAMHPEKVKSLLTFVVPVDFSTNDGLLFRWGKHLNIDNLIKAYDGVVPGDGMNFLYLILKPLTLFMDKYVGMVDKWADPDYLKNFVRMEKWTFDSPSQAGATLSQFIKDMYQENKLVKGELEIGGKRVDLKNVTCPVLAACAEKDHLVPLAASRPLMDVIGSTDKQFLSFATGHIGMFTSSKSQKSIMPQVIEWLKAHC